MLEEFLKTRKLFDFMNAEIREEMLSSAMGVDLCLAKCRSLVLLERFIYLNKIDKTALISENLLDRHLHQIILRISYESDKENFQYRLQSYFLSYQKRIEILDEIIAITQEELYEVYPYYKNFLSIHEDLSSAREKITIEFKKIIEKSFLSHELHFTNRYGFAVFPDIKFESKDYGLIANILNSHFASIGALMYYGFNLSPYPLYCYQIPSVSVLAATLYVYGQESVPVGNHHDWWAFGAQKEIWRLNSASKNHDAILKATQSVFELHEQGHDLSVNGDRTLYYFLKSIGVQDEDLYRTDFATEYDLKSWKRIQEGRGCFKDICFILGDFLANMAAIISGIAPEEVQIMRAINWGISSPPDLKKRPRGKLSFLRYSLNKDFDDLFSSLERIFDASRKSPDKTAQEIYDMDFKSWQILEEHYVLS